MAELGNHLQKNSDYGWSGHGSIGLGLARRGTAPTWMQPRGKGTCYFGPQHSLFVARLGEVADAQMRDEYIKSEERTELRNQWRWGREVAWASPMSGPQVTLTLSQMAFGLMAFLGVVIGAHSRGRGGAARWLHADWRRIRKGVIKGGAGGCSDVGDAGLDRRRATDSLRIRSAGLQGCLLRGLRRALPNGGACATPPSSQSAARDGRAAMGGLARAQQAAALAGHRSLRGAVARVLGRGQVSGTARDWTACVDWRTVGDDRSARDRPGLGQGESYPGDVAGGVSAEEELTAIHVWGEVVRYFAPSGCTNVTT